MDPWLKPFECGKGRFSQIVAPEFQAWEELRLLADPDALFSLPDCEIIKNERKIKVARVPLKMQGQRKFIYLKRYDAYSWRHRLGSLFLPSGAVRSWRGAEILKSAGFLTGNPIAACEWRSWSMVVQSLYLAEEIPGGETIDVYWRNRLVTLGGSEGRRVRRDFLAALASLFRSLHGQNIYHNDLKDVNIIVSGSGCRKGASFYLLDLEGIREYRCLGRRRCVKNIVQLNRTMGMFLRRSEKLCWLKHYLRDVFFERKKKRLWIGQILKETRRQDLRSMRKG